jgi:hypothetical protein
LSREKDFWWDRLEPGRGPYAHRQFRGVSNAVFPAKAGPTVDHCGRCTGPFAGKRAPTRGPRRRRRQRMGCRPPGSPASRLLQRSGPPGAIGIGPGPHQVHRLAGQHRPQAKPRPPVGARLPANDVGSGRHASRRQLHVMRGAKRGFGGTGFSREGDFYAHRQFRRVNNAVFPAKAGPTVDHRGGCTGPFAGKRAPTPSLRRTRPRRLNGSGFGHFNRAP